MSEDPFDTDGVVHCYGGPPGMSWCRICVQCEGGIVMSIKRGRKEVKVGPHIVEMCNDCFIHWQKQCKENE